MEEYFQGLVDQIELVEQMFETMVPDYKNKMDKLFDKLLLRLINSQRPFIRKIELSYTFETLLSDGMYNIYVMYWLKLFPQNNFLVIDGSRLNDQPAEQVIKVEEFLGLENEINHSTFLFHVDRGK